MRLLSQLFCRYDPKLRLEIARHTCHHGITVASLYFSKKLGERVQESTVQFIKKAYLEEIKKIRVSGSNEVLQSFP